MSLIIRVVEFCGRQGIALRGHRDDGDIFNRDFNQGNFKELPLHGRKQQDPGNLPQNFLKKFNLYQNIYSISNN